MSWFFSNINSVSDRKRASAAEIVECFSRERPMLSRLALLITGDEARAEQCVADACDRTVAASYPFQDWLMEWAKSATIACALSRSAGAIRSCEATYKDRQCAHPEHLAEKNDQERAESLHAMMQMDPDRILAELDAMSRAILVLRLAIRSSIQDCVLRLNVSRSAVLAAHCHAMTWLHGAPASFSGNQTFSSASNGPAKRQK